MTNIVGRNISHDSAEGHVTGRSVFIADRPFVRNELHVGCVSSPTARGCLKNIDLARALNADGVVAVFTAKDFARNLWGPIFATETLLADGEVSYVGQPVAVIAAETPEALQRAKSLVRLDIEELQPVLSIAEARAKGDFLAPPRTIHRGDVEKIFKRAKHVIEGEFASGAQEHFYLESQSAIVYPGEHGGLDIHSSTQNPTEVQHVVATALGLPAHLVTCTTARLGGGFGGKESQATPFAAYAALVARKTGRPARIVLSKDEDMITTGKRHPFHTEYKSAFDDRGRILALKARLYADGGAFADLSTAVMERAMLHVDNAYFLPRVEITGTVCRTNHHPYTAFRGFGGPQGAAVIENLMEEIAIALGLDPYDVRRANCYDAGRLTTPYGQTVANNTLPEIFDTLVANSDYRKRRAELIACNRNAKTLLRGISLTAVKFGISFTTRFLNQGSALVNVQQDGTVQVSTGATEMGQGVNTKIRQIVADAFGLSPGAVEVRPTSTEKNSNTSPTAASSGADINGSAALDACEKIKTRLKKVASAWLAGKKREEELAGRLATKFIRFARGRVFDSRRPRKCISFKELAGQARLCRVALQDFGFYKAPGISFDRKIFQGRPFLYYTCGAAVSEVEIDRFTGDLKVRRVDILMDLGSMINPGIDRGQVTGAFLQGQGWVTGEKIVYDDSGALLTQTPTTYKIPNIQDAPRVFNVAFLDNRRNTVNLLRAKGSGEPPLILGISVWTAVKMALAATRPGWTPKLGIPAGPEEILTALTEE